MGYETMTMTQLYISQELTDLFANLNPAPEYGCPRPNILDVYIGRSDKVIQEKN
jgi:hypothetical protein